MILVLCNDDQVILQSANADAANNPNVFGTVQQFINTNTPQLTQYENLFITAHGIQGQIGNADGELGYNPTELLNYLTNQTPNGIGRSLFPANYAGNIYISACYTGNPVGGVGLSFVELFHGQSRVVLPHSNVYGQLGAVGTPMPVPPSTAWKQVANI